MCENLRQYYIAIKIILKTEQSNIQLQWEMFKLPKRRRNASRQLVYITSSFLLRDTNAFVRLLGDR